MGRRRNIKTAGMDKGTLKIVVVALGHTCGVRVQRVVAVDAADFKKGRGFACGKGAP